MKTVARWGIWEAALHGPEDGNPFSDHTLIAILEGDQETFTISGFYDGGGEYRVRFMPSFEGEYRYTLSPSWAPQQTGTFQVTPPAPGDHGPVRTANAFHFAYTDGTPFRPAGTTCYAWTYQPEATQRETLRTLAGSCFNKVRFCIFPKHYNFNFRDPDGFPFEGTPRDSSGLTEANFESYRASDSCNHWDMTRFQPSYFQRIEQCVAALAQLHIQADLILFHPYDRWGFSQMAEEEDQYYLRYVLARLGAYANVWWSLANEYDLMDKSGRRWEAIAQTLLDCDPYRHLRSIHNCFRLYDFTRPWVTHASIQRTELYKCAEWTDAYRTRYGKPVLIDENGYEGNLPLAWGNISPQEMVRRFWESMLRGGYATHGETYQSDTIWWSHGGRLHGESEPRIRFLMGLLDELPYPWLKRMELHIEELCAVPDCWSDNPAFYLLYYGICRPGYRDFSFPADAQYTVETIDTWNMTRTPLGTFSGTFRVPLPAREYMSILIRKV